MVLHKHVIAARRLSVIAIDHVARDLAINTWLGHEAPFTDALALDEDTWKIRRELGQQLHQHRRVRRMDDNLLDQGAILIAHERVRASPELQRSPIISSVGRAIAEREAIIASQ